MKRKSTTVATVAMFFATMLVIHILSQLVFNFIPVPIKPTLNHLPVIVGSILYGPRIGATLGLLMGLISVTHATLFLSPTSYLFSPFVPGGNLSSLVIAILPRILIGLTPYVIYKVLKNKLGLALAGALGSITNTIFVLSGIFIFFSAIYGGDIQALLAGIVTTNSIAEMMISAAVMVSVIPRLEKLA